MSSYSLRLWRRAERVFEAAIDHAGTPEERAAFVARMCHGEPDLLTAVKELLALDEAHPDWLEDPAVSPSALPKLDDDALQGRIIGPYRLVRRIGSGGMGVVYLAEPSDRAATDERIAIKLLREEKRDPEARRRFRRERLILSELHHPNIARLYHGGTTDDGQPYVAMEFVDGRAVTDYCDEHRLTVRARVELVARVARAIEFAHQNLVIHRDVKPSNILVDAAGNPKLLDFGIAKLLAPRETLAGDEETRAENRMFTPQYASPEQIAGRSLTTASDVYSLGLVLYEVLSGERPFALGAKSLRDMQRILESTAPPRPSALFSTTDERGKMEQLDDIAARRRSTPPRLAQELVGDLDNILLLALEADPADRYPSAARLADDLDRYLSGHIVSARAPSFGYRAAKFIRRHRTAVSAGAVGALVLAGLLGGLVGQSYVALREHRTAVQERRRAEEVTRFIVDAFGNASAPQSEDVSARQVLVAAFDGLGRLDHEPELQAALLDAMGRAYEGLGLETEMAVPLFERSLELRADLLGDDHLDVAGSHADVGRALAATGRDSEAEPHLRRALVMRRRGLGTDHPQTAESLTALAETLTKVGQLDESEALARQSLEVHRRLFGERHPDTARGYRALAGVLELQGDADRAIDAWRRALAIDGEGGARLQLARLLEMRGDLEEASELRRPLVPTRTERDADAATASLEQGLLAIEREDYDGAEVYLAEAMMLGSRDMSQAQRQLAETSLASAELALANGNPIEAAPVAWAAWKHFETMRGAERESAEARSVYGEAISATQPYEGERHLLGSHETLVELAGNTHPATRRASERIVRFYDARGEAEEAARFRD